MKPQISRFLASERDQQLQHILILWLVAFFLHGVADPAITYLAVVVLEVGVETNPLIRGWLEAGGLRFVIMHVPLYILGILGFLTLRWLFIQASKRERMVMYYLSIALLSGIIFWGTLLVINTLNVIWYSPSVFG